MEFVFAYDNYRTTTYRFCMPKDGMTYRFPQWKNGLEPDKWQS